MRSDYVAIFFYFGIVSTIYVGAVLWMKFRRLLGVDFMSKNIAIRTLKIIRPSARCSVVCIGTSGDSASPLKSLFRYLSSEGRQ
jgi:hypothetical protein